MSVRNEEIVKTLNKAVDSIRFSRRLKVFIAKSYLSRKSKDADQRLVKKIKAKYPKAKIKKTRIKWEEKKKDRYAKVVFAV